MQHTRTCHRHGSNGLTPLENNKTSTRVPKSPPRHHPHTHTWTNDSHRKDLGVFALHRFQDSRKDLSIGGRCEPDTKPTRLRHQPTGRRPVVVLSYDTVRCCKVGGSVALQLDCDVHETDDELLHDHRIPADDALFGRSGGRVGCRIPRRIQPDPMTMCHRLCATR